MTLKLENKEFHLPYMEIIEKREGETFKAFIRNSII